MFDEWRLKRWLQKEEESKFPDSQGLIVQIEKNAKDKVRRFFFVRDALILLLFAFFPWARSSFEEISTQTFLLFFTLFIGWAFVISRRIKKRTGAARKRVKTSLIYGSIDRSGGID